MPVTFKCNIPWPWEVYLSCIPALALTERLGCHIYLGSDSSSSHAGGNRGLGGQQAGLGRLRGAAYRQGREGRQHCLACLHSTGGAQHGPGLLAGPVRKILLHKQIGLERESKCLLTPYGKINFQMA